MTQRQSHEMMVLQLMLGHMGHSALRGDIINAKGEAVTWAGVNRPMSGETMIPEWLEWASAADILDDVKSAGWNFIRMCYAIEMVDDIYTRNGD